LVPPANPPTNRPANAPPTAVTPALVAAPPITTPAATPSAPLAAPAAVDPSATAGFSVPNYPAGTAAARLDYARMLALRLDSAVVALVEVFRGTTGRPLPGATSPNLLSAREKRRWAQCRLIHLDLGTMSDAVQEMKDSMPGGASLSRAALNLADAFATLVATGECDNVGSMIDAPDRWTPWQSNYESSVGTFFRDASRISSPKPGIIFWQTASVASGVTSRGEGPVPPVVTTREHCSTSHRAMRVASMVARSSGMSR